MILTYCAITFHLITYWDSSPIYLSMKDYNCRYIKQDLKALNYVSAKYGHESQMWGVCLRDREPVDPKQLLRELGYFMELDGDGKACL